MPYSFIIRFLERKKKKSDSSQSSKEVQAKKKVWKGEKKKKNKHFSARKHSLYLLSLLESTKGEAVV